MDNPAVDIAVEMETASGCIICYISGKEFVDHRTRVRRCTLQLEMVCSWKRGRLLRIKAGSQGDNKASPRNEFGKKRILVRKRKQPPVPITCD